MKFGELLRVASEAVQWNRMRSLLTILGIVIGIAAVMVTVGLGEGAQAKVKGEISALGSNLLTISPGGSSAATADSGESLTERDAAALSSHTVAPAIGAVAPIVQGDETVTFGATSTSMIVYGSTASWLQVRSRSIVSGEFFSPAQETEGANVVVLGSEAASELFGGRDPVGETVTVGSTPMTVIGVLNSVGSGTSPTTNEDDLAVVPLTTAQNSLFGASSNDAVDSILIKATGSGTLSAAYQEADNELLMLHNISEPADANFTITSEQSLVSTATSVSSTLTALLAGIAGVSLLVGGIGVMNIMLVSVNERTREIGLRKALGARPRDIRLQFLTEALLLGILGGAIGVGIALIAQHVLPSLISDPISIPAWVTAGAIGISMLLSVIFGVYPATRAAQLSPIEALRTE
ncbi:ABC transporter permease [Ferrimicrobium sp.]|uniref:ABC transporter permease n=1 Tax=Ferrimicrobium sp. TaxID=2926050 RepID=UPI002631CE66|nr:ABC transporter permease [Ferrimicrobium sp.]